MNYNSLEVKSTTPLDPSQAPVSRADEASDSEPQSEPLVLVVDDSIDNLTAISLHLQQSGFRVATATNGEEGMRVAALTKPDIIVMDLAMPGVDGLESTRLIRQNENLKDIPVIALTAFSTEGFRRAAHDTGFDGYLTKPIDFARLHDLIGRLIGLARSARNNPNS
ncbi:MAG TPA: response regulator [Pyrinomonadaceae bacterium]|nr:response regulator [Pyrinomonadaceae bacterium]